MAIDADQLRHLREDHVRVYGEPFKHFRCPILLEDSIGPRGLIDGHVLPYSVKSAARSTVIQRADVDNYFGSKLEADLIDLVNAPHYTWEEFSGRSKISAVSLDDRHWDAQAFAAGSLPPYPKFEIPGPGTDGGVLKNVFVKAPLPNPLPRTNFDFSIVADKSLVTGALLKAAYLAIFRGMGYRWTRSHAGELIRWKLASFFMDRADRRSAPEYFWEFDNCYKMLANSPFGNGEDTVTTNCVLVHFAAGGALWGPFALSCVFIFNDMTFAVMVPYCSGPAYLNFASANLRYRQQLNFPTSAQVAYAGKLTAHAVELIGSPMRVRMGGA